MRLTRVVVLRYSGGLMRRVAVTEDARLRPQLSPAPHRRSRRLPLELDRLDDLARVVLLQRSDVIRGRGHPALFIEEKSASRPVEMDVLARQERLHRLVYLEEGVVISGWIGHGDHLL